MIPISNYILEFVLAVIVLLLLFYKFWDYLRFNRDMPHVSFFASTSFATGIIVVAFLYCYILYIIQNVVWSASVFTGVMFGFLFVICILMTHMYVKKDVFLLFRTFGDLSIYGGLVAFIFFIFMKFSPNPVESDLIAKKVEKQSTTKVVPEKQVRRKKIRRGVRMRKYRRPSRYRRLRRIPRRYRYKRRRQIQKMPRRRSRIRQRTRPPSMHHIVVDPGDPF